MPTPKLLLLAATLSLSSASFVPSSAQQPNYFPDGSGQTITCSSDNGKRNYCNADTRCGVRLSRQISGSECAETRTWGIDGRGLWVDRGCRAEFQSSYR